ncbi:MAG: transposase [Chlamydia sp.]
METNFITSQKSPLKWSPRLHYSEVMAIVILFHVIGYRNFKVFCNGYVLHALKSAFPNCPRCNKFLEFKKSIIFPLHCYLTIRFGTCTGISFIDSIPLRAFHDRRIHNYKVFKEIAKSGYIHQLVGFMDSNSTS